MKPRTVSIAALILLSGLTAAEAAPNIPPSELPGRERYRFQESPLDRFMQPGAPKSTEPVWRWDCDEPAKKRGKKGRARKKQC